jgi:murein DD-endopeptidase MepM/ murein hydrolase activator NlpD
MLGLPAMTTLLLLHMAVVSPVARASGCAWYRVQPGDTLSALGASYGVSVKEIAASNHISNPNLIFVGQQLCIPTSGATVDGNPASNPAPVSGQQAFTALTLPYAERAHQRTGWPVSLILAQWGLEQGWKAPGYTGYNWGNVAALPGEPTVGGIHTWGSPAAFAYAHTPEDGLRYYLHVAALGYYSAVAPAATGGADAAARALGRSPWDAAHYTSHGDPGSALINQMRTYNLYQYDR